MKEVLGFVSCEAEKKKRLRGVEQREGRDVRGVEQREREEVLGFGFQTQTKFSKKNYFKGKVSFKKNPILK